MKVIVGLGNPGKEYENTRHNVGFMVVDKLERELGSRKDVLLVKPQKYMNRSGEEVKKIIRNLKLEIKNLYVVHDDLDVPLGSYKIQFGKGPKVHNGISSIEKTLGTKDFWRVRIGIENRFQKIPNSKFQIPNKSKLHNEKNSKRLDISGEEYVLGRFLSQERQIIEGVIDEVVAAIVERL